MKVGEMLFISLSKLREIEGEYNSDEEREVAVIRYWILRDPYASWRRIIQQLEAWEGHDHAITVYHYSEELTGMLGVLTIHLMHCNYCVYVIVIPNPQGLYGIYCLSSRAEPEGEDNKSHAA